MKRKVPAWCWYLLTCCLIPCYRRKQEEVNKRWFEIVQGKGYEPCATTEEYV